MIWQTERTKLVLAAHRYSLIDWYRWSIFFCSSAPTLWSCATSFPDAFATGTSMQWNVGCGHYWFVSACNVALISKWYSLDVGCVRTCERQNDWWWRFIAVSHLHSRFILASYGSLSSPVLASKWVSNFSNLSSHSANWSPRFRSQNVKSSSARKSYGQPSPYSSSWFVAKFHCSVSCRLIRPIPSTGFELFLPQIVVPWWN